MLEQCCGDMLPFSHKSNSEVGNWCWRIRPGSQSAFQFIPMELRSGLSAGQSTSSTPISTNYFCMDLALCTGELSCWNRKGPSPNCCHKFGGTELSRMSLHVGALRYFTGTKGPNHKKTALDHYSSSKLYSWQYASGQVAFSWHFAKSKFVRGTARWWSVINHSWERQISAMLELPRSTVSAVIVKWKCLGATTFA